MSATVFQFIFFSLEMDESLDGRRRKQVAWAHLRNLTCCYIDWKLWNESGWCHILISMGTVILEKEKWKTLGPTTPVAKAFYSQDSI